MRRRLASLGWGLVIASLRARTRVRLTASTLAPRLARKPAEWPEMSFAEKLAWRGRHPDPSVDYTQWVDKARAKAVVSDICDTPRTYQSVSRWDEVDLPALPSTYVMKARHGWNMSLLVDDGVIRGGNRDPEPRTQPVSAAGLHAVADTWLKSGGEVRRQARERQYTLVEPGLLFEEYLRPIDYELHLFLFNGRWRFAMVFYRSFRHAGATHRLYDEHWRLLDPGNDVGARQYETLAPEPEPPPAVLTDCFERLCRGIDHVRVDLYVSGGRYYFGEFTFTHAVGTDSLVGKYDAALSRFWTR